MNGEQVSQADGHARSRSRRSRGRRYGWLLVVAALVAVTAWALNASRPGTRVEGCPAGCAEAGPRRDGPLRVMSLNVLHGFPRFARLAERLDLIAAEIRHQDADLVLLQEVPWHWGSAARRLAEATGLNHAYVRANGNRWTLLFEEGEAILSRYPLRDAARVELMPRAGFFEHRMALRATAITPWGPVGVVSTHLTHGEPGINRAQAASLAAFVAGGGGGPVLVGGDFNATEDEPQIRDLGWIDAYRAVHPGEGGATCCVEDLEGGPDQALEKRIDYLFLVPGDGRLRVVDSRRVLDRPARAGGGWLWASDHVGVMAEISMEP